MIEPTIRLNNQTYRLARQDSTQQVGGPSARRWQVERRAVTTERVSRQDVIDGSIPGEHVIVYENWNNGIWGDMDAPIGTYHFGHNIETRDAGKIQLAHRTIEDYISLGTISFGKDPCKVIAFDGDAYVMAGQYALKWSDGAWVADKNFAKSSNKYNTIKYNQGMYGAGYNVRIVDAEVFDNRLVVAVESVGGGDDYLWIKDSGTWSMSTDTEASFVAKVQDRLWRAVRRPTAIVNTTNHHIDWDFEAYYDIASAKTAEVPSGTYTESALAAALETIMNATSNIIGTYTVTHDTATNRFTIAREAKITIIANVNNKLDFTETSEGDITVTLAAGTYSCAGLATYIQTLMNDAATDNTYTVSYTASTGKFTIARATGTDAFGLEWFTGANKPVAVGGTGYSVGTSLGYNDDADDTGATTYTSNASCLLFNILWLTGTNNAADIGSLMGYVSTADDVDAATYLADTAPTFSLIQGIGSISNLEPGSSPVTLANWSAVIDVGDRGTNITDLNAVNDRIIASKEDGLYIGDEATVFTNIMPDLQNAPDSDNGKNTFVRGSDIFYPHNKGLRQIRFGSNPTAEEVGPATCFASSVDEAQPGLCLTAITSEGAWIYIATEPAFQEQTANLSCMKTTDGGASMENTTDYSVSTTDCLTTTTVVLDSLDTWVNGNALYIGGATPFYGVLLYVKNPNTNVSTMMPKYWNGSSWVAFESLASDSSIAVDYTAKDNITLDHSGSITWRALPDSWQMCTVGAFPPITNGSTAYWVRFEVSAALSATVDISEIRLLQNPPYCYIIAGRRRDTNIQSPYAWHTIARVAAPLITTLGIVEIDGNPGKVLVAAGRQLIARIYLNQAIVQGSLIEAASGEIIVNRHDGGMPFVNKEWLDTTVWAREVGVFNYVDVTYRNNDSSTFATAVGNNNIDSTPKVINFLTAFGAYPTGYTMQEKLTYHIGELSDLIPLTIERIEIRFRELPTYKNYYQATLELSDQQTGSYGSALPDAKTQLSALQSAMGTLVTLVDPIGSSVSVTVTNMQVLEFLQEGLDYPVLLVTVEMAEV